jgi:hypothetical protein
VDSSVSHSPTVPTQLSELRLDIAFGNSTFSATGAGDVVLRAFSEFKEHLLAAPETVKSGPPTVEETGNRQSSAAGQNDAVSETRSRVDDVPLPLFLSQKSLRGNPQIALGIVLWAKRYKAEEELDVEGVKSYWRNSRHKLPANLSRDIGAAAKEGWLERRAAGKYSATSFGERFFDERPDGQQPTK